MRARVGRTKVNTAVRQESLVVVVAIRVLLDQALPRLLRFWLSKLGQDPCYEYKSLPESSGTACLRGWKLTSVLHNRDPVDNHARLGATIQQRKRLSVFAEVFEDANMVEEDLGHLYVIVGHVLMALRQGLTASIEGWYPTLTIRSNCSSTCFASVRLPMRVYATARAIQF